MSSGRFMLVMPESSLHTTSLIEEIEEKQSEHPGSLIVEIVYPSDHRRNNSTYRASPPSLRLFSPEED